MVRRTYKPRRAAGRKAKPKRARSSRSRRPSKAAAQKRVLANAKKLARAAQARAQANLEGDSE